MVDDITQIKECPDCASTNIVYGVRDQVICRDCGLIYEPLAPAIEKKLEARRGITPRPARKKPARKARKARRKPEKRKAKKKARRTAKKR